MQVTVKRVLECFPHLTQEKATLIYERTRLRKDANDEDYMQSLQGIADILDMPVNHVTFDSRRATYHFASTGEPYDSTIMLTFARNNPHFLIGSWGKMAEVWT